MSSENLDGSVLAPERPIYVSNAPVELGMMLGIAIGIILGIMVVLIYVCKKSWDYETARANLNPSIPYILHALDGNGPVYQLRPNVPSDYRSSIPLDWQDLEDFRLDFEKLTFVHRIATGGFGSVWYGKYLDEPVAIKMLVEGRIRTSSSIQKFIDEVKLMAKLQHDNVVRFIGTCWQSLESVNLVVEYMDMGDLKDHLDIRADLFSWSEKIQCITDVLQALVYLHDQRIIHRDLKSRNILMDSRKSSKLSDFGISREIISKTMSHEVGTFLWAAPEVLNGCQLTVAADIYSFGMLLSELDTHQVPFEGMQTDHGDLMVPMAIVMKVMQGNARVRPSNRCPPLIAAMMDTCTQYEPELRPTAHMLLESIERMRAEVQSDCLK